MNEYVDDAPNVAGWEPTIAPPPPEPTVEMPDVAPNVSSWMSVAAGLNDPYSRESLSQPYQPPAQSYYGASAGLGETFGNIAGGLFDVLEAPSGAVGGFLSGATPRESLRGAVSGFQNPDFSQFRDIGFVRNLPDEDVLPFNLSARDVAGGIAGAVLDPLNVVGIGKADEAARLAGRGIAAGREAIGDLAPDVARGARRLATEEAGGIRLPFGRGDQPPKMDITDVTKALDLPPGEPAGPLSTLLESIKGAKPLEAQNAELLHKFRQQQAARFEEAFPPGSGAEGLRAGMEALRGRAERMTFPPLSEALRPEDIDSFVQTISRAPISPFDRVGAGTALSHLLDGIVPVPSELERLEKVFPGVTQALREANIVSGPKFIEYVRDVLALPPSLMSSFDISGARQVGTYAAGHPRAFARNFRKAMGALRNEETYAAIQDDLANRWYEPLMRTAGVAKADAERALSKGEGTIISKWVNRVPGYRASQRHYATLLNLARDDMFESMLKGYGGDITNIPEAELKRWGKFINIASGRGTFLDMLAENKLIGQPVLYAPRLYASRVQFPFELLSSSPTVRKEAARQLASFVGINTALLSMGKAAGAWDVELDPTSADFGQMRIGRQRVDPWVGFRPFVNLVARLATGERKSTTSGQVSNIDWKEILTDFGRQRLSPWVGTGIDLWTGKDVIGNPFGLKDVPGDLLMPLFFRDIQEAVEKMGPLGVPGALLGATGFGVNTYTPTLRDTAWKDLPPDEQFKAIKPEAWNNTVAHFPQLQKYGGYGQWYEAGFQTYLNRNLAKGVPQGKAVDEANKAMRALEPYKYLAKARDYYETEWIKAHPDDALRIWNEQADLPENERWRPTKEQAELIEKLSRKRPAPTATPKMAGGGIVEDGEKVVITPEQWKTVLEVIKDVVRDESGKMVEVKERHAVPDRPEPQKRVVKETHRSDDGKIARVIERHQEMMAT